MSTTKKYYALVQQAGEGCDYTIACAKNFIEIPGAIHVEDAKNKFLHMALNPEHEDSLSFTGERELESAKIIEVHAEHELNMGAEYRKLEEIKNFEQREAREEAERAEYERLHKKFNG